jgi:hypothetical protein
VVKRGLGFRVKRGYRQEEEGEIEWGKRSSPRQHKQTTDERTLGSKTGVVIGRGPSPVKVLFRLKTFVP